MIRDYNSVHIQGEISSVRQREQPSGATLFEFNVTCRTDSGTTSVPIVWGAGGIELSVGARVAVAGQVRRRFFRAGGVTQSRTEVHASVVRILKEEV